jgi:hypothetical protein
LNEFVHSASIAFLPFSSMLRGPVPVKCGWVTSGTAQVFQSEPELTLFSDVNGIDDFGKKVDFYSHAAAASRTGRTG